MITNRARLVVVALLALASGPALAQLLTSNYRAQDGIWHIGSDLDIETGGDLDVESGGQIQVESGGEIEVLSGATLDLQAGSTVTSGGLITADDLTSVDDVTVGDDLTVTDQATAADFVASDDIFLVDDLTVGDTLNTTNLQIAGTTINSTPTEIDAVADLSGNGALIKVKTLAITSAPTGAEQSTGWIVPGNSIVLGVSLKTATAEATGATKTIDIGILGDPDGFLNDVDVATVNVTTAVEVIKTVAGGEAVTEDFFFSTTRGALLGEFVAGTDAAGDVGTVNPHPWVAPAQGAFVTFDAGSNDWSEFRGTIIVTYIEIN